jgi:two-component system chemotaxis response regulator CheB
MRMETRDIIVLGASAGGFTALQRLVAGLPPDLPASLFIVWHMAPDMTGLLPQMLNRANTLPAANALDGEPIERGRVYVAPPDHHLLLERGRVRVTRGPKEHRFRPAVDPLFRSAAVSYGRRVIGVVLTGALDDGAAGLWTIKQHGGTAIVQDPHDAEAPSMPQSALRAVAVDHVVALAALAPLLTRLSHETAPDTLEVAVEDDAKSPIEVRIAAAHNALDAGVLTLGTPTLLTCPDCHGTLLALREGSLMRFRCHTGHAFSAASLLAALSEGIEDQLWSAVRVIEESVLLLNHLGDHLADYNQSKQAAQYYQKANEARARGEQVRQAVLAQKFLSGEQMPQQADEPPSDEGVQADEPR